METKTKTIKAYCFRTAMVGGGTSYDVYFQTKDKPSHPLHLGHYYATEIHRDGKKFFSVVDAIDPQDHWSMDAGIAKWETFKRLEKIAKRLAIRIAKRAFAELKGARELPFLWASWDLPSAVKAVPVQIRLPH